MAAGTSLPSDFTPVPQIFNAHMFKAFVERSFELMRTWVGMGEGSPIALMNKPQYIGEYSENPYFKRVVDANRRDVTSNAALTAQKLEGANNKGVIMRRRSKLIEYTDDIRQMKVTPEMASAELGRQTGEAVADDLSNTGIAAMIGMVQAVTAAAHTSTVWAAAARTNLGPSIINGGRVLMGDAMKVLSHLLSRSEPATDLSDDSIDKAYDAVAGVELQGRDPGSRNTFGMQRAYVDNGDLTTADAGFDKYTTLLAGANVLRMGFVRPVEFEVDRDISRETKTTLWRADWDLYVESDHMGYDSAAGGANPALATLKASANWDVGYENHKELPLVEIVHNYSGN